MARLCLRVQAKDAVLVDSSEMNIDEVVDAIYQIYARV